MTIIELLQKDGAQVSYNDPYFPTVGKGRKYDLQMKCAPLDNLGQYDCVLIVTDHSDYDYARIVQESQLVVDTRSATRGIKSHSKQYDPCTLNALRYVDMHCLCCITVWSVSLMPQNVQQTVRPLLA